jgi:pimeloyl-ACP methyl ester carboxylesterase
MPENNTGLPLELLCELPAIHEGKPSVFFVHGARHGAWCWQEHFLPFFASQGFPAYAVSLRGHGGSAGWRDLANYRLRDYVDDVRASLTKLPSHRVLIGHSMGGAVVQQLLSEDRQSVCAAVLMASVPPKGVNAWDDWRVRLFQRRTYKQLSRFLASKTTAHQTPFPFEVFFAQTLDDTEKRRFVERVQPESPRIQKDIRRPLVKAPQELRLPMLVVGGRQDWFLSAGAFRRTGRAYGARVVLFDGIGHNLMLDKRWCWVAREIVNFLNGLTASSTHQRTTREL